MSNDDPKPSQLSEGVQKGDECQINYDATTKFRNTVFDMSSNYVSVVTQMKPKIASHA